MQRSMSSIVSTPRHKWLNIVLDLNGILCHCVERSTARRQRYSNDVAMNEFSSTVPTLIGPKGVYVRPRLREFLAAISDIAAHVIIWSSMKRSTVEAIAGFLFKDLTPPFDILGQDSCTKIETTPNNFLTGLNSSKEIFLKVLSERLFWSASKSMSIDRDNTLLIDDSPEKSVCNENGNAIFLDPWTRHVENDDFLMEGLAPWLRHLHLSCEPGHLREYVERNRIGCSPLSPDDALLKYIIRGMTISAKNMGIHYELPGIGGVIRPPHV